ETVKLKLLAAPDRYGTNRAIQDLEDTKAFVSKFDLTMTYENDDEGATIKVALDKFLPTYLGALEFDVLLPSLPLCPRYFPASK
ncbi:hypothetical protein K438DRAFT_1613470, partial [Mycena galopus ATCC 62051]